MNHELRQTDMEFDFTATKSFLVRMELKLESLTKSLVQLPQCRLARNRQNNDLTKFTTLVVDLLRNVSVKY